MRYVYWLFFIAGLILQPLPGLSQGDLIVGEVIIDDYAGNRDGWLDPGETAALQIPVINAGSVPFLAVSLKVSNDNPEIELFQEELAYGQIGVGDSVVRTYYVILSYDVSQSFVSTFNTLITAPLSVSIAGSFDLDIGKKDVLIADFEENDISSDVLQSKLALLDYEYDRMTTLPDKLRKYRSVFVCLGVRDAGQPLSEEQGEQLAGYLEHSGNLYLEGGDAWFYDPETAVRPYFGIMGLADGDNSLTKAFGRQGTITESMSFDYEGERFFNDRIAATGNAMVIFDNVNPSYGIAVSRDGGYYRTIGSSFEFGGLVDHVYPSTRDELLLRYLEFFQVRHLEVEARFIADDPFVCLGESVKFTNYSIGQDLSYQWIFEGGTPSTSTDFEPSVTYNTPGFYLVSLQVESNGNSHFLIRDDYIHVGKAPSATLQGDEQICQGDTALIQVLLSGSPPMSFELTNGTDTMRYDNLLTTQVNIKVVPDNTTAYWMPWVSGAPDCYSEGSDTLVVNIFPPPFAALSGNQEVCRGDSAEILIELTGTPPWTLTMDKGAVITTYSSSHLYKEIITAPTYISVTEIADSSGCPGSSSEPLFISLLEKPEFDLREDTVICAHESLGLNAYSLTAASYYWLPGQETTPGITVDSAGTGLGSQTYTVTVTAFNGCTRTDSIKVSFKDCTGVGENNIIKDLRVFPNPVKDILFINFYSQSAEETSIIFYDIMGTGVSTIKTNTRKGLNEIKLSLQDFKPGVYIVDIRLGDKKALRRLMVY